MFTIHAWVQNYLAVQGIHYLAGGSAQTKSYEPHFQSFKVHIPENACLQLSKFMDEPKQPHPPPKWGSRQLVAQGRC